MWFKKAPAIKPKSNQNDYQRCFSDAFNVYYIHDAAVIFVYWSCLRTTHCVGILERVILKSSSSESCHVKFVVKSLKNTYKEVQF